MSIGNNFGTFPTNPNFGIGAPRVAGAAAETAATERPEEAASQPLETLKEICLHKLQGMLKVPVPPTKEIEKFEDALQFLNRPEGELPTQEVLNLLLELAGEHQDPLTSFVQENCFSQEVRAHLPLGIREAVTTLTKFPELAKNRALENAQAAFKQLSPEVQKAQITTLLDAKINPTGVGASEETFAPLYEIEDLLLQPQITKNAEGKSIFTFPSLQSDGSLTLKIAVEEEVVAATKLSTVMIVRDLDLGEKIYKMGKLDIGNSQIGKDVAKEVAFIADLENPSVTTDRVAVISKGNAVSVIQQEVCVEAINSVDFYVHQLATSIKEDSKNVMQLLFLQLADEMQKLHGEQKVHLDIKPVNFLLKASEEMSFGVALTDFGAAGKEERGVVKAHLGTSVYSPPEQRDPEQTHLSSATDIFSLGLSMLEISRDNLPKEFTDAVMKNGTEPMPQGGPVYEAYKTAHQSLYDSLGPDPFHSLVKEMIDLDPKKRPTAEEVFHALMNMNAQTLPDPPAPPAA